MITHLPNVVQAMGHVFVPDEFFPCFGALEAHSDHAKAVQLMEPAHS